MKAVAVVINSHSRRGFKESKQLEELLAEQFKVVSFEIISRPKLLPKAIAKAARAPIDMLVVGGGDGTLVTAVNILAHTKVPLGILPLGTTNNFARSLEVPLEIKAAIDNLVKGSAQAVNLGKINEHYYVNIAAIGLSVKVASEVSNNLKRLIGRLAYYITGLRWLLMHRAFSVHIKSEGNDYHFKTHQLLVANGRFHSALPITPYASIKKNSLLIVAFGTTKSRFQHLKTLVRFALGSYYKSNDAYILNVREAVITTKPSRKVETDGEVLVRTPIKASIGINAVKVVLPKATSPVG